MFGRIIKTVGVSLTALAILFVAHLARGQESFELPCVPETTTTASCDFFGISSVKTTGITKGVALYACSTGASDALPSWWQIIWNPYRHPQYSVARYFKDVSRGNYQLDITPYGRDTSHCIVSNQSPGSNLGNEFIRDVILQADTAVGINFADFDNDGPNGIPASQDTCCGGQGDDDGYVDAVFVLAQGLQPKQYLWGDSDLTTHDTGAHGQYIKVKGVKGLTTSQNCQTCRDGAYYHIGHDWGHVLGLPDLFGQLNNAVVPEYLNWWVLGSFSVMGTPAFFDGNLIPYDPYSQIKLGWVDSSNIIEVDTPFFAESIPNFVTSGKIFKIKRDSTEYFLVTNHKGVYPEDVPAGFYERNFKGYGLLIWHIDETGCYVERDHKFIDLELAHGLWNYDTVTFLPDTLHPNPRYGKDSLDLRWKPETLTRIGWSDGAPNQSFTCFWNDSTKENFDGMSNPSSDGYRDSVINSIRVQDVPTLIGVRNISATRYATATADLLANSWYGHLTQNMTWGPGTVSVIGDVTVDSGTTLTVAAGTTIKFRKDYDYVQSGVITKSELVVKGTLNCVGTVDDSIIFTSSASSPSNTDWGGVVAPFPGRASFEFTRFSYADTTLAVRGDTATVTVYNSTFSNFDKAAVSSRSAKTKLGGVYPIPNPPDCGKNNFWMSTASSGAKAVIKSSSPGGTIKAEGNWWDSTPPPSSYYSGNVDRTPYLTGYATPDSCGGGGANGPEPPPEERISARPARPTTFELSQNYPNPFNPTTTIQYALPKAANVELRIFNILGQEVRMLVNQEQAAGYYQIPWDGKDQKGCSVSTGIYLYQIKAGDFVETKKMQLIK